MRRNARHIIAALFAALAIAVSAPAVAASPKWESPKTERTEATVIAREGDITVKVAKGTIIVTSTKPVQIKVFTILGQLISQETIPAGTSQLTINTHGVFIVKTGDLTCKVAL